jgi:hypothetical protein
MQRGPLFTENLKRPRGAVIGAGALNRDYTVIYILYHSKTIKAYT